MNIFNLRASAVLSTSTFVMLGLAACESKDDASDESSVGSTEGATETTASASSTGPGTTSTDTTAAETSSATSSTSEGSGGQTDTSTTGGGFEDCEDAQTQAQCEATSNKYMGCSWFETTVIADAAACEPAAGGGMCMLSDQADSCSGSESSLCDSSEILFVRPLERGFELVLDGPYCTDGIGDFVPCDPFYEEGTALADACACGCSLVP